MVILVVNQLIGGWICGRYIAGKEGYNEAGDNPACIHLVSKSLEALTNCNAY
jgi:hypothetical protein